MSALSHAGAAGAAHDPSDRVALFERQFRHLRAALARHTRHQRSVGCHELVLFLGYAAATIPKPSASRRWPPANFGFSCGAAS